MNEQELQQAILAQEKLRGTMPDTIIEGIIATLRQQLAEVQGSVITGEVKAGGHVVGRDQFNIHLITAEAANAFWRQYNNAPPPNLEEATRTYLAFVANRYLYLDFRGMGTTDRVALRLPLKQMYVPLKARIEMPKGETWARKLMLAGRKVSEEEAEAIGQRLSEPQPVLDLIQKQDGLIVLGDPGAGKTTFLKYLALQLALGEELGLGQRLPVLIPLAAYANALAERDIPLHRFIAQYHEDLGVDTPLEAMLQAALAQGGALILLDGLDEVQQTSQRHLVVNRVLDFFNFHRQKGNKFILTSRIVGYRDVRPNGDMGECTLVDFNDEEIQLFIEKWTIAIEEQAQVNIAIATYEAEQERTALLEAMQHNEGVRQLASNPLLLTILALMKRQGVVLPNRRVELYDRYVTTLLKHWNLARGLGRPPTRDLDVVETIRVLAPLALWIHETNPGVGLVKREDVRRKLIDIYTERKVAEPEKAAERLLLDARVHANLLVERGAGQYGFIHLTFQEYLAAVAIAQQGQQGIERIVKTLAEHIHDDTWREVTLLTIGQIGLIQQLDERAGAVLMQLIEQMPGEVGQAVLLAGEAVADVGDSGVTPTCKQKVIEALMETMTDDVHVPPAIRIEAGRTLGRVGDPRPEVMTVAGMRFCLIPAGTFWMGNDEGGIFEKPCHQVNIPYDYWLGQFPVTNAQFAEFVEAGGYAHAPYWHEAKTYGYWQEGKLHGRCTPLAQGIAALANQPMIGISWYEALAFCSWLEEQGGNGIKVALPQEAEWEKAARGGIELYEPIIVSWAELKPWTSMTHPTKKKGQNPLPKRLYPWGIHFDENNANYKDASSMASTLGCFRKNTSLYGVSDLSGNVNEWTQTKLVANHDGSRRVGDKGDEHDHRIIRGGDFSVDKERLSCTVRNLSGVCNYDGFNLTGFRVCVHSSSSVPL